MRSKSTSHVALFFSALLVACNVVSTASYFVAVNTSFLSFTPICPAVLQTGSLPHRCPLGKSCPTCICRLTWSKLVIARSVQCNELQWPSGNTLNPACAIGRTLRAVSYGYNRSTYIYMERGTHKRFVSTPASAHKNPWSVGTKSQNPPSYSDGLFRRLLMISL